MSESDQATEARPDPLVVRAYPEASFGGFTRCDGTIAFLVRVRSLLPETGLLLDVGCGRGQQSEDPCRHRRELLDLRGPGRRMIGIDVDPAASCNPFVDEFRTIASDHRWPIDDSTIDLAICNYVLEHVANPTAFFDEAYRVLKPGGVLCLRTPNKRSYPSTAARLVPNRFHARVVSKVQDDRQALDVFPTVYRCNTGGAIRRQCRRLRFDHAVYSIEGEPDYLRFSPALYRLFAMLHPLTPPSLRTTLFLFARKNAGP